jgi:hypothetical protein
VRLDTDRADLLVERGRAQVSHGALDEGIADYTAALELNEKHVDAYCWRARARGEKNEWTEMIDDRTAALRYAPTMPGPTTSVALRNHGWANSTQRWVREQKGQTADAERTGRKPSESNLANVVDDVAPSGQYDPN